MLKHITKRLIDYVFRRKSLFSCLYLTIGFLLSQLALLGQSSEILKYCNRVQENNPDNYKYDIAQVVKMLYVDGNVIAIIISGIIILILIYAIIKTKYSGIDPIISINGITGIEIKNTTTGPHFWICIESLKAGSSNFKVQSLVVAEYQDGTFKSFNRKLLPRFTKNLIKTYQSLIPFDENIVRIYIYLKGTYKDLSETKTYKLDDLYYYDCESETTYGKIDNQRPKIISLMQELNKN